MRIPLITISLLASSAWSIAPANQTSTHNPKTTQRPSSPTPTQVQRSQPARSTLSGATSAGKLDHESAKLQMLLQQKLQAGGGQNPSGMSGGMQQGTLQGLQATLGLNGGDDCNNPDVISGAGVWAFDTTAATTGIDGQNESLCNIYGLTTIDHDVWYTWTAPSSGIGRLNLCTGTLADTKAAAYAGSGCPASGTAIGCNDDFCNLQSQVDFPVTGGNTYTLQLGSFPGAAGGFGAFQMSVYVPPPNDDCSNAIAISGAGPFAFDTTGGTTSAEQSLNCTPATNDIWYVWTAPSSGICVMSLCGSTSYWDTVAAVYAGSSCPASGTELACNDDYCAAFSAPSEVHFLCTTGSSYMFQIGGWNGYTGPGSFTANVFVPPANDDCNTPTAISGTGTFSFDNTLATTGIDGQNESLCAAQYGQLPVPNDVWFAWTAPSTGRASLSTCGITTVDTKIGIYPGSSCPAQGTAIACTDDSCGVQTNMCFDVTGGQSYMIQIGTFPGAIGGVGQFDISVGPANPLCTLDDGTTENLLTWFNGGDMVWLNRFGTAGQTTVVSSVDVLFGSVLFPGYNPGNGTPSDFFVWQDDATQNGDPSDSTLLLQVPITVSQVDTDTYVSNPITPLTINGVFFVGCHQDNYGLSGAGPTQYVAPMDSNCPHPGVAWFFGNNSGFGTSPVDYTNPANNVQPPFTFDSIGLPCQVCVRAGCNVGPASYLCDPGSAGTIACPCSNPPAGSGRGCDNSSATGGASILGSGSNTLSSPTLAFATADEKPTATSILLQGSTSNPTGLVFGQGVRCAAGVLKRLYVKTASGGSITAPNFVGGDIDIPTRSSNLGDPITAGQSRTYMVYYRDPVVLGGCSGFSTFNATNTAEVLWQP